MAEENPANIVKRQTEINAGAVENRTKIIGNNNKIPLIIAKNGLSNTKTLPININVYFILLINESSLFKKSLIFPASNVLFEIRIKVSKIIKE